METDVTPEPTLLANYEAGSNRCSGWGATWSAPRQFLRAGRALERAEKTARIVDVEYHTLLEGKTARQPDSHQWMAVLKSVAAYEVYRREFHSSIDPQKVAELLVLHPRHPRSIRFNIGELQTSLQAISLAAPGTYATEAERLTGKLHEASQLVLATCVWRTAATTATSLRCVACTRVTPGSNCSWMSGCGPC